MADVQMINDFGAKDSCTMAQCVVFAWLYVWMFITKKSTESVGSSVNVSTILICIPVHTTYTHSLKPSLALTAFPMNSI